MVAAAEATSIIAVPVFVWVMIELTFTIYNILDIDGLSVHLLPRYVVPSFRKYHNTPSNW
jgi:hypothetical protein